MTHSDQLLSGVLKSLTGQQMKKFFYRCPDCNHSSLPQKPTDDQIRLMLANNNYQCPLNQIVVSRANEGNLRNLRRFAFTSYKRPDRSCRSCNFGIYAPPGQGKTYIVKRFAETIGIPFVFVQSPTLESTYMLFEQICEAFVKAGVPEIVESKNKKSDYTIPPCIVFFDEAHTLRQSLMKGGLLNAMEPDDAQLVIKTPGTRGETKVVDCRDVCWVAATTERGDLFDAFEMRLTTPIEWHPASDEELPIIIHAGLTAKVKSGEIPFAPKPGVCSMIAKYQKVPRLAIHGFGVKVVQQIDMVPSTTWQEACAIVANDIGLNEFGFTAKQVAILSALGKRPIAEPRLADIARCRLPQIKRFELPGLMQYTNGGPYVVSVSGKGMCVTKAGLGKLEQMRIPHKGEKVTAEYIEGRR